MLVYISIKINKLELILPMKNTVFKNYNSNSLIRNDFRLILISAHEHDNINLQEVSKISFNRLWMLLRFTLTIIISFSWKTTFRRAYQLADMHIFKWMPSICAYLLADMHIVQINTSWYVYQHIQNDWNDFQQLKGIQKRFCKIHK